MLALLQSLAQDQAPTMLPAFLRTELLPNIDLQRLRYLYHYSKYYEQFVDTFLLVASGRPIGAHMAFHHLTMPVYTLFRTLRCSDGQGGDWAYFTICNLAHHTLMYAYFGGVAMSVLGGVLFYTQVLQLGFGIGVDGRWFWEHRDMLGSEGKAAGGGLMGDREQLGRAVSMLLLTRFAQLYWREYTAGMLEYSKDKEKGSAETGGAIQGVDKGRTAARKQQTEPRSETKKRRQ